MEELLSKQEVLDRKEKLVEKWYIYFLIKGDEIVYVGQTTIGATRVMAHRDKDFDYVTLTEVVDRDVEYLNNLEAMYIVKFSPIYNSTTLPKNSVFISKHGLKKSSGMDGNAINKFIKKYKLNTYYGMYFKMKDIEGKPEYEEAMQKTMAMLPIGGVV